MVASLSLLTLTLSALSLVSARPIRRGDQPEGYLEAYNVYKERYTQLGCSKQHGTPFFDLCCHPMLATEELKDRDPSCDPANAPTSTSASSNEAATSTEAATPTAANFNSGDNQSNDSSNQSQGDYEDDEEWEDCDDDDESQQASTTAQATTSSTTEQQAPPTQQATSTTEEQAPTSTPQQEALPTSIETTSTTQQEAPPTSTEAPPPTSTTSSQESQPTQGNDNGNNNGNNNGGNNGGFDLQLGGFATWFTQNGVAGACGDVHGDGDLIAAIDGERYGNLSQKSGLCGKQVAITNNNNGKSVTVTIVDACPTCNNGNSIDLSQGAFQAIASLDDGLVPISWHFV